MATFEGQINNYGYYRADDTVFSVARNKVNADAQTSGGGNVGIFGSGSSWSIWRSIFTVAATDVPLDTNTKIHIKLSSSATATFAIVRSEVFNTADLSVYSSYIDLGSILMATTVTGTDINDELVFTLNQTAVDLLNTGTDINIALIDYEYDYLNTNPPSSINTFVGIDTTNSKIVYSSDYYISTSQNLVTYSYKPITSQTYQDVRNGNYSTSGLAYNPNLLRSEIRVTNAELASLSRGEMVFSMQGIGVISGELYIDLTKVDDNTLGTPKLRLAKASNFWDGTDTTDFTDFVDSGEVAYSDATDITVNGSYIINLNNTAINDLNQQGSIYIAFILEYDFIGDDIQTNISFTIDGLNPHLKLQPVKLMPYSITNWQGILGTNVTNVVSIN